MTEKEFSDRTEFYPTPSQWERISAEYMASDDDKDKFCSQWVREQRRTYAQEQQRMLYTLNQKNKALGDVFRSVFSNLDKVDEADTVSKRRTAIHEIYKQFVTINQGYERAEKI